MYYVRISIHPLIYNSFQFANWNDFTSLHDAGNRDERLYIFLIYLEMSSMIPVKYFILKQGLKKTYQIFNIVFPWLKVFCRMIVFNSKITFCFIYCKHECFKIVWQIVNCHSSELPNDNWVLNWLPNLCFHKPRKQ